MWKTSPDFSRGILKGIENEKKTVSNMAFSGYFKLLNVLQFDT